MKCEDVLDLLGAFIDDELSVEIVAHINRHIADCLQCQEQWTALSKVRSRVHDLRQQLDPPAAFVERLKEKVETRLRADQRSRRLHWSSYLVPLAAAAAAALFILPDRSQHRTDTASSTIRLTAQDLYSYEHDLESSKLKPVEYGADKALPYTGFEAQAPEFDRWQLVRTCVTSVGATKAIKYSYSRSDNGKVKTMACYQFRGGVFDASGLAHHVIDGRSICCGTRDNVSLVYWKNTDNDFVLASDLPRADLLAIALDS